MAYQSALCLQCAGVISVASVLGFDSCLSSASSSVFSHSSGIDIDVRKHLVIISQVIISQVIISQFIISQVIISQVIISHVIISQVVISQVFIP